MSFAYERRFGSFVEGESFSLPFNRVVFDGISVHLTFEECVRTGLHEHRRGNAEDSAKEKIPNELTSVCTKISSRKRRGIR